MNRLASFLLVILCFPLIGQDLSFKTLRIDKKKGAQTGPALVTVKEKPKRIASHAFQAWPIMDQQNALVIVFEPKNLTGPYRLRYVEGSTRKRRDLGSLPFTEAALIQHKLENGSWIFVLSGVADGKPDIVVTDTSAIHGRVHNAIRPTFEADALSYQQEPGGQSKTSSIPSLMGTDMEAIYKTQDGKTDYAQFLSDGRAVLSDQNGSFRQGNWSTDGVTMDVELEDHVKVTLPRADLTAVDGVPAGSRLSVRLLQPLSSYRVKEGDKIEAVLISPAIINGKILIPQGSLFSGTITKAHGVGWGIGHETAAITADFVSIKLTNGSTVAVHSRLEQVENAKEKVTGKSTIQGIRSTGTLGQSAANKITAVAAAEPIAYLFATASASAAFGFAEPEILYPAGTELLLQIESPLLISKVYPSSFPAVASSEAEQDQLQRMVRSLPFRTVTNGSHKPSDLTNLAFIGSPQALQNAFRAAGWVATDQLTANSTFKTVKTLSGNQTYQEAPMSILLLDERPPLLALTKTTNTFSSRHHIRVFNPDVQFENSPVLTASSTQDVGIAFSGKTFIHVIDQRIDNERSKVVNDLEFTGCVDASQLVPRPWTPQNAFNSTGDQLQTDGGIVVLRLNSCLNPKRSPSDNAVPPSRFERIVRDTTLTIRNDILRGNIGYQTYSYASGIRGYLIHKGELRSDPGAWRKTDLSGATFKGVGDIPQQQPSVRSRLDQPQAAAPDPSMVAGGQSRRWEPPRYEIGLQGGYLHYANYRGDSAIILLTPKDLFTNVNSGPVLGGAFADESRGGWTAGIFFKANTWKWFSNQFSYNYQHGHYLLEVLDSSSAHDADLFVPEDVGLITRQFDYNLLFNLRPPRSRWRPYLALGPSLQLLSLADAPLKKAPPAFKIGLQNVGALLAAFNFAGDPPLEGGGIFQLGLQYGGGFEYRVHPRIAIIADFRETWSKNPHFITNSYTTDYFASEDLTNYDIFQQKVGKSSAFRQDRFSLGVAFTF